MATLEITVSLPEDLAIRFVRAVPAERRSHYLAELLEAKLKQRDQVLIDACERANDDPETREIELEMTALPDTMTEDWNGGQLSPAR